MPQTNLTNFQKFKDVIDACRSDDLSKPWQDYPCVEWHGCKWIKSPFDTRLVGRIAFILYFGEIPEDHDIWRFCRNKKCVRPAHLKAYNALALLKEMLANIPDDPAKCVEWPLLRDKHGYGRITNPFDDDKGNVAFVHRVAWDLTHERVEGKPNVLHSCDNPPCFRPSHLFPGTMRDNTEDALKKGRLPSGPNGPGAKLTIEQVRKIRELHTRGFRSSDVSNILKVKYGTIRDIMKGKTWKGFD